MIPEQYADLPILSIRQPWASLIVRGVKLIENRRWKTTYRGDFLIHASRGLTRKELEEAAEAAALRGVGLSPEPLDFISGKKSVNEKYEALMKYLMNALPRGGIVGKATLVDCVTSDSSEWFTGPFGFKLANVEPLEFTPCAGRLGFWSAKRVQTSNW